MIISCNSHFLDTFFIMCLVFNIGSCRRSNEWILVTPNSTRVFIFITNTSKQYFIAAGKTNLWQHCFHIPLGFLLILIEFSEVAVLPYSINHLGIDGDCNTWLWNVLAISLGMNIQNSGSCCVCSNLPQWNQTIMTTRSKYCIISTPCDASNSTTMSLELEIGRIVTNIKTIDVYNVLCCVGSIDSSKILASIRELDLLALFELTNLSVMLDLIVVYANIHQSQSISQTNYDVKSWWVYTYTICLFIEKSVCLHTLLLVIPNSDILVNSTCNNKWFTNTNIHTVYWICAWIHWRTWMKWQWDQFKLLLFFQKLFSLEFQTID